MKRPNVIPSLIAIAFLLGSFGHWPYDYYVLLRFVVCGSAAYVAYFSYESKIVWAAWVFGIMAVLFNPIFKIHMDRGIWQFVDIVAVIIFAIGIARVKPSK